jgi:hypothetical protein
MNKELALKIDELEKAKENVIHLVNAGNGTLIDMHGLKYWAGVVERLRQEVSDMLPL